MPPQVKLVAATRYAESAFWAASHLGRSLQCIPEALRPASAIAFSNTGARVRGLGEIYNQVLDQTDPETRLVFLHDDVYLNDWFLVARVLEALERFDIVGVAGSANPDLAQPSWCLAFDADLRPLGWQPGLERSGCVNHLDYATPNLGFYGPTPMACQLLDGAFLAVRTAAVKDKNLRFDPRFAFHCYDTDFCRTALRHGLRLGTWPIAVTHASGGDFASEAFRQGARAYLEKWT